MTRRLPLGILAFIFAWLAANASTTVMWAITGVAVLCLIGLFLMMFMKDMFIGPGTLVDDMRLVGRKLVRDRGGEADEVEKDLEEAGLADVDDAGLTGSKLNDRRRHDDA